MKSVEEIAAHIAFEHAKLYGGHPDLSDQVEAILNIAKAIYKARYDMNFDIQLEEEFNKE